MSEKENIGWVDMLRITACFLVVFSHCSDSFVAQFGSDSEAFGIGVFCGSLARPCVPLFVMMTALLLLPIKTEDRQNIFYKKRIGRILPPLIFWSLALPLLTYGYFSYVSPDTSNPQLTTDIYTPETLVQRITTFIFNFNFDTTPLWYLYMLTGLYLVMPILNSWLVQATKKEIETILGIWLFTLFIPYIKMLAPLLGYQGNYGNMELFGICDWNIYGTFHYLSGFIGYMILAYYLKRYPLDWGRKKIAAIGLPMFLIGYAITSLGYIKTNEIHPGNYAYLEIIWFFTGINVFMMTFPLFIAMQKTDIPSRKWLSQSASLTFGIYLCHFPFTFLSYDIYNIPALPYIIRILLASVTTFAISMALVWLLSRYKITRIFIK